MDTGMAGWTAPRLRVAGPAAEQELSRTYPGRPEQARPARAFVRGVLPDGPAREDAVLAAAELINNAIGHSRSGAPGGLFTVHVLLRPGRDIRVEVDDEGGPWDIRACGTEHGRGLAIVAALAGEHNWGVAGDASARTVWVRFTWPGAIPLEACRG
jgi:serine/threonine-protein kinase RsbW